MNVNFSQKQLQNREHIYSLLKELQKNEKQMKLENAYCYYDFPVYKGLDDEVLVAQLVIISEYHGILVFYVSDIVRTTGFISELENAKTYLDDLYSVIFTRLLRNRYLRKDKTSLLVQMHNIIYFPSLEGEINKLDFVSGENFVSQSFTHLEKYINGTETTKVNSEVFAELISTFEGAKGLIRIKERENVERNSKGDAVNYLEKEIANFDQYQKIAFASVISGVNRVRGLAGSGKTVVLAIKSAMTHLRYPDAKIAYTFSTKSLYQHIKRLITRFYRQFDDRDPNWDNLEVLHAWGGKNNPGIYYNACTQNEIYPLTYAEALAISKNAFNKACNEFLDKSKKPKKLYDYIFIDEGQDFPPSFLKLCIEITKESKILWAYDELQTIFQSKAPTTTEIFGLDKAGSPNIEFEDDIILYKCYRNPREVLVVAHAIGFGLYGKKIVQMIENKDYWSDIGYTVENDELKEGVNAKILRPEYNSLKSISNKYSINEIIRTFAYENYQKEIYGTAELINKDIKNGLIPEDILVVTVDDRNAS
jgi:superfamily I DNA and RNA helicase